MARVEVVMPQMGESIVEGTIVEWLKQVGDTVAVDEDVFTLSTDKVDAEVPSPVAGVLVEHRAAVGDVVPIGAVVAVIDTEAGAAATPPAADAAPEPAKPARGKAAKSETPVPEAAPEPAPAAAPEPAAAAAEPARAVEEPPDADESAEDLRGRRSTPVVRKIAAEHGIEDLSGIEGSGAGGRVTKKDIVAFIERGGAKSQPAPAAASAPAAGAAPAPPKPTPRPLSVSAESGTVPEGYEVALVKVPRVHVYEHDRVEPMTRMRASIADNMIQARRGTAHCHTIWEADMTRVIKARKALSPEFEKRGVKLTFTAFFVAAVVEGLRRYPLLNAAIDGRNIVYRGEMNIGVAAAVDEGLIVPVLKNADTLNLFGIARGVNDLAARSKGHQLKPQDVADGTFSVSNAGIWGSLFGIPILVPPQVGILGIGGIKKRVIADENDNIRVRSLVNMCLTFDHRLIDGATADGFMSFVCQRLGSWE